VANNDQAFATVDGWIKSLQAVPGFVQGLPAQIAPIAKREGDKAIAEHRSLDGEAWAPRKEDGAPALEGTQKDFSAAPSGNILWLRIKKGLTFSQFGTKHQQRRRLLPKIGLPDKLGNAIRNGVIEMAPEFLTRKGGHKGPTKGVKWL
jgi:hypothetical protein